MDDLERQRNKRAKKAVIEVWRKTPGEFLRALRRHVNKARGIQVMLLEEEGVRTLFQHTNAASSVSDQTPFRSERTPKRFNADSITAAS